MRSYDILEWGRPLQTVVRETPVPVGNQVLVRVQACGVCHSDVHIWDGHFDMGDGNRISLEAIGAKLPFTLGHEIVGVVEAVGPEATVPVGMQCVVFPWIGCGECRHCLDGREIDCEANVALGTRRPGGFSDHVLVPHSRYILDYGQLDPDVAATCACSGLTAYSAVKKLPDFTERDTVVLIGAGGLGLAALGLCRSLTPAKIVVADIDERKLAFAMQVGADDVINLSQTDVAERLRTRIGDGVRGVIDFVGSPSSVNFALKASRKGGTVIIVGLFGGGMTLPTALLPMRNISLIGSYVGTLAEMKELLELARRNTIFSVPLRRRPMEQINEILTDLRLGQVQGRVLVTP